MAEKGQQDGCQIVECTVPEDLTQHELAVFGSSSSLMFAFVDDEMACTLGR